MASSVYYKFRSQKSESRIQFDGTGISVFDLKREILLANNLGKANDFDLALYDQHDQEYKDDSAIIPRSSSVIVSRLPAARPGKGRAAHYVAGVDLSSSGKSASGSGGAGSSLPFRGPSGPMSRRFDKEDPVRTAPGPGRPAPATPVSVPTDEAAGIAAMFAATEHQWEETQEKMTHAARVPYNNPRGGGPQRKAYVPHTGGPGQQPQDTRPTPPGYVCYRCGQKGHWIQDCPTNNDREYDNRPRIKRTTGIPRSFLKAVEQPTDGSITQGVMITPEGGYVVAQPDALAWQKQSTRTKVLTEADIRAKPPADASLACLLCSRLFREAVKTPCCGAVYCEECIQTHLLEHDFDCPACRSKIPSLDKLVPEKAIRARVQQHINKALAESNAAAEAAESGSSTPIKASQAGASDTGPALDIYSNDASLESHQPSTHQQHPSQQLFPEPSQIQAQIEQIHTMLRNPTLTQQARMQLQRQLPQLNNQLEQARMVAQLAEAAMAAGAAGANGGIPGMNMGGAGYGMMNGGGGGGGGMMPGMGMGGGVGMGMGMGMGGGMPYHTSAPTEYRPQWTNPFPNQQPASSDSAYQRLPVNNRRRGMKRDRPSDFVEVGGDGPSNKVARYWE
ncbi:DWNN-domain-containing protein [Exidia glandulosa HHB12029]|uniref:DWNN-domain-containing protein n=1 Tax=Exidia glandulosa HHB12029 TaxID=1314781 RepID=A0A165N0D9_EXIGL|nr:DWNN-domain-containing protein [Exidia glandulosa HHB12029]